MRRGSGDVQNKMKKSLRTNNEIVIVFSILMIVNQKLYMYKKGLHEPQLYCRNVRTLKSLQTAYCSQEMLLNEGHLGDCVNILIPSALYSVLHLGQWENTECIL